jgi:hypothetical protein
MTHIPIENKIYDMNASFQRELQSVCNKLPKYHMNMLLGDFDTKPGREDIFESAELDFT